MGVNPALDKALLTPTDTAVRRWTWASLVANATLVLTGGLVRLTGSGLGCPTWPKCTPESFTPHRELGINGVIEFGNRVLTYVLTAIAVGTLVAIWRWAATTPFRRRLAVVLALGIPLQAVIGGITVLTDLNPWIVSLHLLLSMLLVAGSMVLIMDVRGLQRVDVPPAAVMIAGALGAMVAVVVYLGTVVTGSGPHAGDAEVPRNGLNPQVMSHIHAGAVYLLIGLTVLLLVVLRNHAAAGAVRLVLAVELAQGVIGFVQYFTDLPVAIVAAHLVGAAVLVAVTTRLLVAVVVPVHSADAQRSASIA
ncbi:COX15/CtaA family protein [Aeromicrobium terrae]|uniref:Heme A synthase n=1 Tax=Aeromicrobium terrae TaxID=2498846 RepID=A0A5C8NRS3_9ACTN|nr:COX15/CtaA family protein [Aeromicrobium terrae]TXL63153.1 heme A synthase [Aeromicrobium terrae]